VISQTSVAGSDSLHPPRRYLGKIMKSATILNPRRVFYSTGYPMVFSRFLIHMPSLDPNTHPHAAWQIGAFVVHRRVHPIKSIEGDIEHLRKHPAILPRFHEVMLLAICRCPRELRLRPVWLRAIDANLHIRLQRTLFVQERVPSINIIYCDSLVLTYLPTVVPGFDGTDLFTVRNQCWLIFRSLS